MNLLCAFMPVTFKHLLFLAKATHCLECEVIEFNSSFQSHRKEIMTYTAIGIEQLIIEA